MPLCNKQVIAAFDFDHTLTRADSLVPFLVFAKGYRKTLSCLFQALPSFFKFFIGAVSRQQVKEALLSQCFQSIPYAALEEMAVQYADQKLDCYLREEAMNRLKWHQNQGHFCVLVSASLETYLIPWGKRHGFDLVIASRLQKNSLQKVTGCLEGENCWGQEKVRRLQECLGNIEDCILYAYGDSLGDQELLAAASHAFYRKFS